MHYQTPFTSQVVFHNLHVLNDTHMISVKTYTLIFLGDVISDSAQLIFL